MAEFYDSFEKSDEMQEFCGTKFLGPERDGVELRGLML